MPGGSGSEDAEGFITCGIERKEDRIHGLALISWYPLNSLGFATLLN